MFYIWIAWANTQNPLLFSQVNISRKKEGHDLEEELRPEHMFAVISATEVERRRGQLIQVLFMNTSKMHP